MAEENAENDSDSGQNTIPADNQGRDNDGDPDGKNLPEGSGASLATVAPMANFLTITHTYQRKADYAS